MPSILKCSVLTNLFNDFKLKMGQYPPERLGMTNSPLMNPSVEFATASVGNIWTPNSDHQ